MFGKYYEFIFRDVYDFMLIFWMSNVIDRVYNIVFTVEILFKIVCDRWFNDEIIECVFKMFNRDSKEYLFFVVIELLLYLLKV